MEVGCRGDAREQNCFISGERFSLKTNRKRSPLPRSPHAGVPVGLGVAGLCLHGAVLAWVVAGAEGPWVRAHCGLPRPIRGCHFPFLCVDI